MYPLRSTIALKRYGCQLHCYFWIFIILICECLHSTSPNAAMKGMGSNFIVAFEFLAWVALDISYLRFPDILLKRHRPHKLESVSFLLWPQLGLGNKSIWSSCIVLIHLKRSVLLCCKFFVLMPGISIVDALAFQLWEFDVNMWCMNILWTLSFYLIVTLGFIGSISSIKCLGFEKEC